VARGGFKGGNGGGRGEVGGLLGGVGRGQKAEVEAVSLASRRGRVGGPRGGGRRVSMVSGDEKRRSGVAGGGMTLDPGMGTLR
jgi:hypothetical protein